MLVFLSKSMEVIDVSEGECRVIVLRGGDSRGRCDRPVLKKEHAYKDF